MDVRADNRGRPHQKVLFPAAPVVGRNFLTPGHPGVRVRNVRRKSGPKSLCLCCSFFPDLGHGCLRRDSSFPTVLRTSAKFWALDICPKDLRMYPALELPLRAAFPVPEFGCTPRQPCQNRLLEGFLEVCVCVCRRFLEGFLGVVLRRVSLYQKAHVFRLWLSQFLANFDATGKFFPHFPGSTTCYPCQGLGTLRQGKWQLENRPRPGFSPLRPPPFLSFSD